MTITSLSTKGQVVIPADVRRSIGLNAGDLLILDADPAKGSITLTREPTWEELSARFTSLIDPKTPLLDSASDYYANRESKIV